jgi:hypothetical protein
MALLFCYRNVANDAMLLSCMALAFNAESNAKAAIVYYLQ